MKKIRILIADDHSVVRIGLSTLLSYQKDLSVVGEAENGAKAVAAVRELKPDVVIMDLVMPELTGVEATRAIRTDSPGTKVLILTSFGSSADAANAVAAGASGVIMKDSANQELIAAIRTVAAGGTAFSADVRLPAEDDEGAAALTERQLAILQSAARGLSNREIALQFDISKDMVKHHLSAVFAKLGAATRAEAVAIALSRDLLKTPA